MRKQRSRGKGNGSGKDVSPSSPLGVAMASIGLPNLTRRFIISNDASPQHPYGPKVFTLRVQPFDGLWRGYADKDPKTNSVDLFQEWGPLLDTSVSIDSDVYPVTPYAQYYDEDLYRHYETLTQMGFGARLSGFTRKGWLRIQAMTAMSFAYVKFVINLNHFVYNTDWSVFPPFTKDMPPFLWHMLDQFGANTVDMARFWVPLMQRIEQRILPPAYVMATDRMLTPFLLRGRSPIVVVPWPSFVNLDPQDLTPMTRGYPTSNMWAYQPTKWMEYLDENAAELFNIAYNFFPWPVAASRPWTPRPVMVDESRALALANSSAREFYTFDNNASNLSQVQYPASDENMRFYRSGTTGDYANAWAYADRKMFWDAIQFIGLYQVGGSEQSTLGVDSRLFTPHNSSQLAAFADNWEGQDDNTNWISLDGYEDFDDVGGRYFFDTMDLAGRFRATDIHDIGRGWSMAHYLSVILPWEACDTELRLSVKANGAYDQVIKFYDAGMGSRLQQRKRHVDEIAGEAFINPAA